MECAVCLDAVSAELDGELDPRERVQMDEHLAGCGSCRETASALRQHHRSLRLRMVSPAPDLGDAILASALLRGRGRRLPIALVSAAAVAVAVGVATTVARPSAGERVAATEIEVHDARVSTGRAGGVAEVYFYMSNSGEQAVVVDVTTPLAEKAELHATEAIGQVSTMVRLSEVDVPSSGAAMLAPGSTHVMLVGLKTDVEPGDEVPVTLHMSDDTTIEIAATAMPHDSLGT